MSNECDIEQKERLITILEDENTSLKLLMEEKDEKINELDKWVAVLTDMQSDPDNERVINSVK